jgi:2',3'-cyclic-nucleotide 2'-phosphodiesterase (5'-nucleotidase family)
MGGLSRKAYMIKQIQNEGDKPVLLLDGGALLFDQPAIPPSLLPARTIQAGGVSQAMQTMHYAAIGIAAQDLAGGLEFLLRQGREHGLTLLSANLVDRAGKKPFNPLITTRVGETSVAIIGLTGEPAAKKPGMASEEYRLLPWQEALPETIKQARGTEMIILLSSYPEPVNREIAGRFPDIHLIIQSGTFSANKAPHLIGNTLLTQVAAKGKYLGRLDIDWNASRRWGLVQNGTPQLQQAKDNLDRIKWRLGRLEKRSPDKEGLAQNSEYQKLRQEQDRLTAEIARLDQPAGKDKREELATFTSNFIPLKTSLPEDPEVQKIVQQTKQEVNRSGQKNSGKTATGKALLDRGMTGWRACQACHPEQVTFWQKSRHAGAWQTLVRERQQANQDCMLCHVTLPAYDLQTVHQENLLASLTEDFQGVGCEACHGPGGKHVANPGQVRPLTPTEKTCLTCHTPDHDNDFSYEKKLPLIRCPASAPKNKGAA